MKGSRRLFLSVIICTKNREPDLALALSSVLDQTELPDEIVVVDAGDSTGVQRRLERQLGGALSLTYAHTCAGLTRQRNTGIRMATGQAVLFLDDDVYLATDFVEVVKRVFSRDEHEKIHAVQCCIVDEHRGKSAIRKVDAGVPAVPIWSLVHLAMAAAFLLLTQGDGSIKASGFQARAGIGRCAGPVEALSGCACFRRSAFSTMAFDEELHGYGWMEDVDISRQLKAQ